MTFWPRPQLFVSLGRASAVEPAGPNTLERLRTLAESFGYHTDEDVQLLADVKAGTTEAWRKRGKGPDYVRIGNRILYPRKALAKHLESLTRERPPAYGKDLL